MAPTESGPVDIIALEFPGNQFKGELAPALRDLVEDGLIRVIDLLFVFKDDDGTVGSIELAGLEAGAVEEVGRGELDALRSGLK